MTLVRGAASDAVWMHADIAADQTSVGIGTDVIFDQVHSPPTGVISLNVSTGVFTLPAGHVFELEALIYTNAFSLADGSVGFEWVYEDNAEIIGAARAICRPVTGTGQHSIQPEAAAIINATEETKVKLRCVAGSGTCTVADLGTNVIIKAI